MKIAIFPGSFDPFTIGHESILRRAIPMFDKIIVMIGFKRQQKVVLPAGKTFEMD